MTDRFGVGIIGIEMGRSWAAVAHVPALRALPDYEIVAVSTRRMETADVAAGALGCGLAFDDHHDLVSHPAVDVVAVTVKVPHHLELVSAAIDAGKAVVCEWPLGNGLLETTELAERARRAGVPTIVGAQMRFAPVVDYVRKLIGEGYVGEVLSTTVLGSGLAWGPIVDATSAYLCDRANGATMLTIPVGHAVDGVCACLGELTSLSATMLSRRTSAEVLGTGETVALTAEDQVAFAGTLDGGAVATFHYRGGVSRGVNFLWEINGTEGDLQLSGAGGNAQIGDLTLVGGRGTDSSMQPMPVPAEHRWVPESLVGPAVNVAQMYARFAAQLRGGVDAGAGFDHAVVRHRTLAAVEESASTGARVTL